MNKIFNIYNLLFDNIHKYSSDVFKLFARFYVADAFFRSGLLKISNWDTTLYLFESEYSVPFLPFELAAILGTAAELILPVFLVLGLATRLVALKLFLFNIIAVVSYPAIWDGGYYDHKLWAVLLLVNVIYGQGRFSLDSLICHLKHK